MLRSLSLFSGCGGLDLGLHRAGFQTVLATDAEPLCAATYRANFPRVPFIVQRMGQLTRATLLEHLGANARQLDLVCGGPPCPPFSKSRFYLKDKPRALDDPNGWETVSGYLDVLDWLRPRAFVLENVKGLAYKIHQEALDAIIDRSERLGYKTQCIVLNAADYGVPQIRERCFVIGALDGHIDLPAPTHGQGADGSGLLPWVSAGQVLSDLDTDENACDAGHYAGGQHHHLLRQVPPGSNYLHFTEKRGHPNPLFKWRSRYWYSFLS